MAALDPGEARRLAAGARVGRLATVGRDGQPHAVPVCFAVAGEVAYSAVDEKPKGTRRLQRFGDVEANPRVVLLVDHYEEDWDRLWWVQARGTARAVGDGEERDRALALLRAKYRQYEAHRLGEVLAVDVHGWTGWAAAGD